MFSRWHVYRNNKLIHNAIANRDEAIRFFRSVVDNDYASGNKILMHRIQIDKNNPGNYTIAEIIKETTSK